MARFTFVKFRQYVFLVSLLAIVATGINAVSARPAAAVTASDWNPARIIDDEVFYNKDAMTVPQIQQFLNAKVPVCDTWGTKMYNGMTRRAFSEARGVRFPLTCLKDYYENTTTHENNLEGRPIPAGAKSAAQIIWENAQQYNINPQVLLVILQREQGLILDDWPWPTPYFSSAMGYACPDSGPNHSIECQGYYGFSVQVEAGAWQLRRYANYPNDYNFVPGRYNYVQWSPQPDCGGTQVFIENQPTASLYNYAPYQPNQAALNNMYGTGDGCSAYANRNFWRWFNDWFGTTRAMASIVSPIYVTSSHGHGTFTNEPTTVSFYIKNNSSVSVDIGTMAVAVRSGSGQNFDYGGQRMVIPPFGTGVYSATQTFAAEGTYTMTIVNYREGAGWSDNYPTTSNSTYARTVAPVIVNSPLIDQNLVATPSTAHIGENVAVSFRVKNRSASSFDLGGIAVTVRDPNGNIQDYPMQSPSAIAANGTYTFSAPAKAFTIPGTYTLQVSSFRGGVWGADFPATSPGITKTLSLTVKPNPTVTTGIQLNPASPRTGQPVTASFTVTNYGDSAVDLGSLAIAARDPNGAVKDYPLQAATIAPHSTFTFSATQTFTTPGQHKFDIVNYKNGVWSSASPLSEDGAIVRSKTQDIRPGVTITGSLGVSPTSVHVGQSASASFTVTNYTAAPVDLGGLAVAVRDPSGAIKDYPLQASTVGANTTLTYSAAQAFTTAGRHSFSIVNYKNGVWSNALPALESDSVLRTLDIDVKPNPTVTTGLQLSPTPPHINQAQTISFTVTNFSGQSVDLGGLAVAVRDPNGAIKDFPLQTAVIAAGGTFTYSAAQTFTVAGQYRFDIVNYKNGVWSSSIPVADTSSILRSLAVTIN